MILGEKYFNCKLEILDQLNFEFKEPLGNRVIPHLDKLPQEKKIVPIILNVHIATDTIFRDEFDWDLDEKQNPFEFA